jgi:hypothetical protein
MFDGASVIHLPCADGFMDPISDIETNGCDLETSDIDLSNRRSTRFCSNPKNHLIQIDSYLTKHMCSHIKLSTSFPPKSISIAAKIKPTAKGMKEKERSMA